MLFQQKIHWRAIFAQIGLLLHVPAAMAGISLIICMIFGEWYALLPFAVIGIVGLGIGQSLYRCCYHEHEAHLWDAMIIAALSWLLCSFLGAVPICWISVQQLHAGVQSEVLQVFAEPINSLFESFSGFTSTGLTMMQKEGPFPYALQWWRSFLEWIGGLGLVVFVLSLTHLNREGFQLYYAEARSEQMAKDIRKTAHFIWAIYFLYTCIGVLLFFIFGMPIWEAINHSMTVISTGGFTITTSNFKNYDLAIQIVAIVLMFVGAISFAVHYQVIREGRIKILWKSLQHRLLYFFLIGGGFLILLLNFWNGSKGHWVHSFFEWASALTTCGFSTIDSSFFSPMVKLFLIIGMFIGGATGSTAGGLKIRRLLYIASGIFLRILAITQKKEKMITGEYHPSKHPPDQEPPGIELPHTERSQRLFTAGVLFTLWTFTLIIGWFFVLKWTPPGRTMDALFEVVSAMSNVGLSNGLMNPEFPTGGKWIFMFLMWIGRLEIIPALILIFTLPLSITSKRSKDGKK